MKRGLISIVTVFCLCLFFAAARAADPPATIKIGGVYSLTGADSNVGKQVEAGYTLAIEDMNKKGGVFVKEFNKRILLELVAYDMEANAEKAISRTETLISSHHVKAFVGTTFFAAAAAILERSKVPAVAVASAGQRLHDRGFKFWFNPLGTSPRIAIRVFELMDSLPKEKRPTKFVIFEEKTDWGTEMSQYFQKELGNRSHYTLTGVQKHTMMTKDYSPLILASKSAGAEVLLASPIMPDGMSIMRQMKELDFNPKAVVMIRACDDLPWARALGTIGDYVIFGTGWHYTLKFPGIVELNKKHGEKYHRPADPMTGPAYAAIQIIADAIERAGTLDTVKIRDAIAATDMMSVTGPIKFNPDGTNQTSLGPMAQWQKGKQELVFPLDLATKPLVYPIPKWNER
jgi:branched-chain amino acid transport system substrate-binding protein